MGVVIFRTDPFLVDRGHHGADASAKDENGDFIVEKIDIPQKGGVLVVGDLTKKPEYSTVASVKARKWKSRSRRIREAKAWFPWNAVPLCGSERCGSERSGEGGRIRVTSADLQYLFGIRGLSPIA
jgi:hypothetical protein